VNKELFVSAQPKQPVIISKSQAEVERARTVLAGQAPNGTAPQSLIELPNQPQSFFFLALARGFNDEAPIPPQAKVLKMADTLRLALGENGGQVLLNIALKAKNAEVCQQIQQVLQGIVAVVALGQVENKDLQQLVQSIQVTTNNLTVNVDLKYPVAKVLDKIQERHDEKAEEPAPSK